MILYVLLMMLISLICSLAKNCLADSVSRPVKEQLTDMLLCIFVITRK
jgi:hypothetical protein